ncbi:MAG: SPOR domain-containing protein [Rhodocyclales bacterium]|nr:SPOR domain-containing protein [Rhodocyclales bacterium]
MIPRNGDIVLDQDALAAKARRASLYRAALALALMSALLAGLLLEDDAAAPAGEAPAPGIALPPVALRQAPVAPFDSDEKPQPEYAGPVASLEQGYPAPAASETVATSTPVIVESAHAADASVVPKAALAYPGALKEPAPAPAEPATAKADPVPDTTATAATDASAAPEGFRVQLGQFADMRSATALRDTLSRQGYAARLQVRVGVGPYEQRKAAESALAKMRRERGLGGLIVAPPSGKGLIVQLGVFAEQRNADELAARVNAWGYATRLHARVVVGPYPDQQSAQAALRRLQRERTLEGVVIMPAS